MTQLATNQLRFSALACIAAIVLGAFNQAHARQPSVPTDSFGITASHESLWVYQQRLEGQPQIRTLRLAFTTADASADDPFRRPNRAQAVTGDVAAAAVLGDRLYIIFADGTHRSYDRRDLRVERKLPRNCVPLILAADSSANALYALVPTPIAAELPLAPVQLDHPTTAPAELTASPDESDLADPETPTPTTAPAPPPTAYSVVRYSRGTWQLHQPGPDFLVDPTPCLMAVTDGQCHLIVEPDPDDADALYCRSDADGWTAPIPLPSITYSQTLACGIYHGRCGILVHAPDSTDPLILWAEQDRFETGPALDGAASTLAATWFGSHLALAFLDTDSELSVGTWPMSGGVAQHPPVSVGALVPRHVPWLAEYMPLLAYGGLALVMLVVFTRRRDSLMTLASLEPGQTLAPFSRRLLGFLLDLMLFLPIALYVLWPAMEAYAVQHELDPGLDRMTLYRQLPVDFFVRWLVTVALFALYGSIFEGLFGATPGKRIVHCKVVDEKGQPPRLWAVLSRNFLRLIEMFPPFDLMPAAVLVILTRNRQRLGDLIARTIVVQIVPTPPEASPPEEPPDPAE